MKWLPWLRRHPDPEQAARSKRKATEARALEVRAHAAIARAELVQRRRAAVIKENHLGPKLAAALREHR